MAGMNDCMPECVPSNIVQEKQDSATSLFNSARIVVLEIVFSDSNLLLLPLFQCKILREAKGVHPSAQAKTLGL